MEIIKENFCRIESLVELLKKGDFYDKNPRRLWLRRLALLENLNTYYRFACNSVLLFQRLYSENYSLLGTKGISSEIITDQAHSSAVAFYSHGRVCIETMRQLSEETLFSTMSESSANSLQEHRDKYASWARDFINIRNAVVAHPHEIRRMITDVGSWGTHGIIYFPSFDLEHIQQNEELFRLEPTKDLEELRRYIEETLNHLKLIYGVD